MKNQELTTIYRKHFAESFKRLNEFASGLAEQPANPLLINPPEGYFDSQFKIMYFGQETNSWGDAPFDGSKGVDDLLKLYDTFANQQHGYNSPFWQAVNALQGTFCQSIPSAGFTWNNIIKIGKHGEEGLPSEPFLRWQKSWNEVIREEVRILAPDFIVFFTGPCRDDFLQVTFGPIEMEQVGEIGIRGFAKIRAKRLPMKAVRTYHPNYLRRQQLFDGYLKDIVAIANAAYKGV